MNVLNVDRPFYTTESAFSRFLEVRDHVQDVVRDDWSAEFVEVQRLKPDPMEWRPNWLALSAMLDVTFRSED